MPVRRHPAKRHLLRLHMDVDEIARSTTPVCPRRFDCASRTPPPPRAPNENARVISWTDRLEEGDHFRGNGVGGDDRGEVPDTRDLADASVDNVLGDVMR